MPEICLGALILDFRIVPSRRERGGEFLQKTYVDDH